jgi:diguanylate cyclase (GGDEF)-like protein/PAS domain S-box-containing protein
MCQKWADPADITFLEVVSATSVAIVVTDPNRDDNPIVFVNAAFTALTGYAVEQALGRNCRFLQGPDSDPEILRQIRKAVDNGLSIRRELINYRRDGTAFWMDLSIDFIRDQTGRAKFAIGVQNDVTEKYMFLQEQEQLEQELSAIIDNVPGFVFRLVCHRGGFVAFSYISSSITRILGLADTTSYAPEDLNRDMHPDDRRRLLLLALDQRDTTTHTGIDLRLTVPDGHERWFRASMSRRTRSGGEIVWDGLALDITAEKASALQLAYVSDYDTLTGLLNRERMKDILASAIDDATGTPGEVVVLHIELNDFVDLNDAFGQSFGDAILRRIGVRLKEFGLKHHAETARVGSDDFVMIITDAATTADPFGASADLLSQLGYPMFVDGREIAMEACIGISSLCGSTVGLDVPPGEHVLDLLKKSHLAVQAAKREGPGTTLRFSPEHDDSTRNRVVLRQSLHQAVAERQFELHYQPLVELETGRIVGAEALVRWNHPQLGLQRPDLFIPLAESSGLIVPLGNWIISAAMQQARSWADEGIAVPRIAINLSAIQLKRPSLVTSIEQALRESRVDPRAFEFELTETSIMENPTMLAKQLAAIKAMGFQLAMDDFGTGHSTLKYLRDFSFDKIKIDQTFVRQLVIGSNDASIIRAILTLSRSLHMAVVAEGIETTIQRDFLYGEGCKVGQGYLFSMPLKAEDFAWLLRSGARLPLGKTEPVAYALHPREMGAL